MYRFSLKIRTKSKEKNTENRIFKCTYIFNRLKREEEKDKPACIQLPLCFYILLVVGDEQLLINTFFFLYYTAVRPRMLYSML